MQRTHKHLYISILLLSACGGGGGGGSPVSDINQNTAPEITGISDYAIDENSSDVATFQATDAEGDNITYSISGDDASLLSIESSSGVLSFQSSPDFDNPRDSNIDNIYQVTIVASDGQLSTSLGITISVNDVFEGLGGQNMLLMGNSFFRPYARRLNELALDAEFLEHRDTGVFRGGVNGTPIGLWNNEDTNNEIKQLLDGGNIDMLGMTGYYNQSNPTSGFSEWIEYALQKKPNVKIFISIPPIDFPADWQQTAEDAGLNNIRELYEFFVNDHTHKTVIDQLREMYPSTVIFSIPTGWATFDLEEMHQNDLLLDDISLFGSFERAIFTDAKGHQGEVVVTTGALIWLSSIYGVHLRNNDFDTGFNTDLHTVAEEIVVNHDPEYINNS
ncbi:MAG: cadherin repeat domain-containing protein [Porticoccaceae bacterium]|nr:cadherin repeat domain-containing protein [Porticoccaceae bacterium]